MTSGLTSIICNKDSLVGSTIEPSNEDPAMKHAALFLLLVAATPTGAATLNCVSTPGLAVDADGAPDSYRVDGKGLSFTCDGVFALVNGVVHTQKNDPQHWQALCTQHWNE